MVNVINNQLRTFSTFSIIYSLKKIILLTLIGLFFSCKEEKQATSKHYYNKNNTNKEKFNTEIVFTIDTLEIDSDIETSFNGNYTINKNTIVFNDLFFAYLFQFDKKLKIVSKHFGLGKNANELLGADYVTYSNITDKYYVLSSKTGVIAVINSKFKKEKEFEINFNIKRSREEVTNKPLAHLMDSYEIDYGYDGLLNIFDENHIAIAITSSHPKFNGYFNSKYYYENSRVIALINIEDEYIDRLIGRRPPLFLKKQLPNYDHFNYQVVNDSIYLNFYPEATIYKIDKNADTLMEAIGVKGKEMKTDYVATSTYSEAYKRELEDYTQYDFYNSLYVNNNLVFRGYTKNDAKNDGMQIYKNQKLLADLDFPKGYKIIGKIDSYYYASKISIKRREDMTLLKLKITGL